jgi:hypothetical protein
MHHSMLSVLACEFSYNGHEPPRGADYGVDSHESPDPGPGATIGNGSVVRVEVLDAMICAAVVVPLGFNTVHRPQ